MTGRELFVYYKVPADRAGELARAVRSMLDTLRSQLPGLQARLLVRDEDEPVQTWMEVYARDPAGIDDATRERIDEAARGLRPRIEGERHVEVFRAADSD